MEVQNDNKIINLEDFFEIQIKFFKFVGLDIFPKTPVTNKEKVKNKLMRYYFYMCIFCFVTLTIQFGIHILVNIKNLHIIVLTLPNFVSFPYSLSKTILLYVNRKKIFEFLNKLRISYPSTIVDQQSSGLDSEYKWFNIFTKFFVFLYCLIVFTPTIEVFFNLMYYNVRTLPDEIWFPFDPIANSLTFMIVVVLGIWAIYNSVFIVCAVDLFLCAMFIVLAIEFKIIGQNIKNAINEKSFVNLRNILIRHQELIDIAAEIKSIFSFIFFYTFIQGAITISSSTFQLIATSSTTNFLYSSFYATSAFVVVFMYCYFGEKLITQSESIALSIYDSNWYEIDDIEMKKLLLLIIVRSQKGCTLSGYGFVTLSIDTYSLVSCTSCI
ncbi:hypothetical protein ACKWTF_000609 [Chironomus riparius]